MLFFYLGQRINKKSDVSNNRIGNNDYLLYGYAQIGSVEWRGNQVKFACSFITKGVNGCLLAGVTLMTSFAAWSVTVTDVAGRTVQIPEKVNRILLEEGRLFHAIALLEGNKPLARIIGWQGNLRKLDPQSYAVYKAKFSEIDKIPLIGNTSAESVSAEKVLTLT